MNSHIISASAGTGKTYQLALRFIALLVCGISPDRLIAITFTRKAAGEFKDRILLQLAGLAVSPSSDEEQRNRARNIDAIKSLINSPVAPLGLLPGQELDDRLFTPARFRELLKQVITNLSQLYLSTNDSLFSRLNTTLSYELGVNSFTLMDDLEAKQARQTALRTLGRLCVRDREENEIFQEILDQTSYSNDPEKALLEQVEQLHILYQDAPPESWGNLEAFGLPLSSIEPDCTPGQYIELLEDLQSNAEEPAYYYFLQSFRNVPRTGKIKLLNRNGKPSQGTIRENLKSLGFEYSSLKSDHPGLARLISSALSFCWQHCLRNTVASYRLLREYDGQYHSLVRGRGKFVFDDVTRNLSASHISPELIETLRYRLFCRWDHWLLDEFQDTSRDQWKVLKPFVEDVYESNDQGSALFVGDTKQSIYGWRGGDPAIFKSLTNAFPCIIEQDLTVSYRSVPGVLALVNTIFDGTSRGKAIDYLTHTSAPSLQNKPGCSQIWQPLESPDKKEAVYQTVYRIINEVGVEGKTIAVLVTSNKQGRDLAGWLKSRGVRAEVIDDVSIGQDSPLMKSVLHFFTWLLHPGDGRNQVFLQKSLLWQILSAKTWKEWKTAVERNGYAAVLEYVLCHFPHASRYQLRRLEQVMPFAADADRKGMSLQDWVVCLKELKRRENPPSRVVQIMTIHKSKGLGFDVVILPQLEQAKAFSDSRQRHYLIAKDGLGQPVGIIKDPGKVVRDCTDELAPCLDAWEREQVIEGYCLLYVALTRAQKAVYVVLQHVKGSSGKPSEKTSEGMVSILREQTNEQDPGIMVNEAKCLYAAGQGDWYREEPGASDLADKPQAEQIEPLWPVSKPLIVSRKAPSDLAHGENMPEAFIMPSTVTVAAAQYGTQVHAVFERITRWNQSKIPGWAVSPATPAERVVADCLNVAEIRELFMPPDDAVILKEQKIEAWSGDEHSAEWISGTIDRLVLRHNSAHIIDFKTDRIDCPESLVDRHSAQLASYRDVVSRATGIPLEAILCTLVSTHLKQKIDLFS